MSHPSAPLCLIHGWAANHHVFDPLYQAMPPAFQEAWHAPDLPGHGNAAFDGVFDLAVIADGLADGLSTPSHVLGWSLGGVVAIHLAARHPHKVKSLCLSASFAKFAAADDYPEGLRQPALDKMATLFRQDYPKYMRQFLELQLLYTPERRPLLNDWIGPVVQYGPPPALEAALAALAAADVRPLLPLLRCPVLLLFGDKDGVTPPRMGEYLHRHLPGSHWRLLPQAGHAPFLSHTAAAAALLTDFWKAPA